MEQLLVGIITHPGGLYVRSVRRLHRGYESEGNNSKRKKEPEQHSEGAPC